MLTLFAPDNSYGVEAELIPFPTVVSRTTDSRVAPSEAMKTDFTAPTGDAWLLVEAIELADWLGWVVVEAELDEKPAGAEWSRAGRRLWLDLLDSPSERLAVVAEALRGEPRLSDAEMSPELAAYLTPRRAA